MKKIVSALLLTLLCLTCKAQQSQTEYNFLRLPVSAHAAALGGDNISIIEDDASLMLHNPALAASVSDGTIGLNYMNYMSGANYASASYTKVLNDKATLGVAANYVGYGEMKQFDESGIQQGTFSATELAAEGIFAYSLAEGLVGGITGKFVYSSIAGYSSMAVAVDLGLNYYDPEHQWSLSAVAKNLGGEVKAYDETFGRLPFDLQLGVSKTFEALPVRLSVTLIDLTHYNYRTANHLDLGADILLSDQAWIGIGYNFRKSDEMKIGSSEDASAHGAGLSFGAGLGLERFKINLAYGKYHVSSHSLIINLAYTL